LNKKPGTVEIKFIYVFLSSFITKGNGS